MNFDPIQHPYASRRMTVYGRRGMVATSHPQAAQAGLEVLRRGGNAIDAAVAAAAALTVVEPTSNGIGGDAFALVWSGGKLHGLNASGPAPAAISIDALTARGYKEMPKFGWAPVTVPGVPAAWASLISRFGNGTLSQALAPAIELATEGHAVAPIVAKYWGSAARNFRNALSGTEFDSWFQTFTRDGQAPQAGDLWHAPHHARTLTLIGESNAEAFYRGELADKIDAFARETGGFLRKSDLSGFVPEWVNPIRVNYRGYDVWEIPPNGQGLIALIALNILNEMEFTARDEISTWHRQIEAMKLAFADGKEYITDPNYMAMPVQELLSAKYAASRRALIGDTAHLPAPGKPDAGGTVYLATADTEGNMVSYIQSNYMGFGSGLVVPGTGIGLQNRGHTFSLDANQANSLEPGKRTYHTIIPGFLTKDDVPVGPFGVMGGFMQPQGHLQVVMNTVDFHLNPQAALDAPRWQWLEGNKVSVERSVPEHIAQGLAARGHVIQVENDGGSFGRGEIIWRLPNGMLAGGTESRADGSVAAW